MRLLTKAVAASLVAAAALLSQPAFANVITIGGGPATITCSPSCEAFTGGSPNGSNDPTAAGSLSSTVAQLYDGVPSNESDEASKLSILIGTAGLFIGTDGSKSASNPPTTINSLAEYLVLKLGNERIYVKNTSGGQVNIVLAYNGATGLGLSHFTEFGEADVIPVPGALWLMGAGIAGLGFGSRRKKKI